MEERTKQRLVGVLVFLGALFIILPFLFHNARPSANAAPATVAASTDSKTTVIAVNDQTQPAATQVQPMQTAPVTTAPQSSAAPATPAAPTGNANSAVTTGAPAPSTSPVTTNNGAASMPASAQNPSQFPSMVPQGSAPANNAAPQADPMQALPAGTQPPATPSAAPAPMPAATPDANATTTSPAKAGSQDTTSDADVANNTPNPTKKTLHAANPSATAIDGWTLQLGAFSDTHNVTRLTSLLREHRFHVYTRAFKSGDRTLTAVFVGPERNLEHARLAQEHLRAQLKLNGQLKRYES